MALFLKQSTAVDVLIGPFLDISDGATAETGESITVVRLSKNGQALSNKNDATAPVHDDMGYYNCELNATDTNTTGTLVLTVEASATALPVRHEFYVVTSDVYDMLFGSASDGADGAEKALETYHLDHLFHVDYNPASKPGTATALLNELVESDGGISRFTANALEQGPSGGSAPTAGEVADAVWDEAKSGHTTAGTFGEEVQDHALSSEITALNDLSAAEVNTEVDTALSDIYLDHLVVETGTAQGGDTSSIQLAASGPSATNNFYNSMTVEIIGGTGVGQSRAIHDYTGSSKTAFTTPDWGTQPDNTSVYIILATATGPDRYAISEQVWDENATGHQTAGTFGEALGDPAASGNSVRDLIAALNDISSAQVNSEVDTALADYDAPTKAEMDAGFAALNDPSTTDIVTALASATRRDTAQAGAATTITLDASANGSNDHYNGCTIVILEGTGADVPVPERTRRITGYVGSTKVATIDETWATNPSSDTVFLIIGQN